MRRLVVLLALVAGLTWFANDLLAQESPPVTSFDVYEAAMTRNLQQAWKSYAAAVEELDKVKRELKALRVKCDAVKCDLPLEPKK